MKLTGAQILIETLLEQGADAVFGYPGGAVLNIYDELYKYSDKIKHVLSAHEQGAAHAADGYARATGKVGVVIATSGPGATNLVTGIANAYLDSTPMVAITGNVACSLIGRDSFQEVDIVGITLPITKHNYIVKDVTKLADTIREAFKIAKSGRPGPVLIDIPKDVQTNQVEFERKPVDNSADGKVYKVEQSVFEEAAEIINKSKKPYIYCGGGIVSGNAHEQLQKLATIIDAPIGFSMMGLSAISHSFKNNLGMVGMHGHYAATKAMNDADLIIAVGVRFSDRATGNKNKFASNAKIIHIDIDEAEIDKNISSTLGIGSEIKFALEKLLQLVNESDHADWHEHIARLKEFEAKHAGCFRGCLSPQNLISTVNKYTKETTPIATDVGQHQMWVAQYYKFRKPRTFITSGGLGTMGFGMGAAIGACVASKERTILFTGDGSFGMNLNELATAVSQNLPLVVIILNNGVLGMVRQWQTMFYHNNYSQTTLNRKTDFVKLAEAFGAVGLRANDQASLSNAMEIAIKNDGPVVIDCVIECDERVLPMIPPNGSVDDLVIN